MKRPARIQLEQDSVEEHIIQEGQGIILTLDENITTQAIGLMLLPKHGDRGYFNDKVFENISGVIKQYVVSSV